MPTVIVATAGASDANSYVTVDEADAYWYNVDNAAWTKETVIQAKMLALTLATRAIDRLKFIGKKLNDLPEGNTAYQALEWPRITNASEGWYEGVSDGLLPYTYNDSGTLIIPKSIREACCEQANWMLETGEASGEVVERIRLQREGVRSFSVPGLMEQYGGKPAGLHWLSPNAAMLLNKYVLNDVRVFRG